MATALPPESAEMFRRLTKRIGRGLVIFQILKIAFIIVCAIALLIGSYSGAAAAFMASLLGYLGFDHVQKRYHSARLVAENPEIVYWAHPTDLSSAFSREAPLGLKFLTLHLRNGRQFEASLDPEEMQVFIDWLSARNPSVRWGAYDNVADAKPGDTARLSA